MKFILLSFLLTSCAHQSNLTMLGQTKKTHYIKTERVIGLSCPNNHYLGIDYMCHKLPTNTKPKPNNPKPLKKPKKQLKIDCKRVFEQANQCMRGE